LHKLVVSTLRDPSRALKAEKDQRQASVLIDALAARFPEWLTSAAEALDERARPRVATAAARTLAVVPNLSERAKDFLGDLAAQT
jgi:hypothetical protein